MSRIFTASIISMSLVSAGTAFAHDGDHSGMTLSAIGHWLTSPSHSLFAVIGGLVIAGGLIAYARKNRA